MKSGMLAAEAVFEALTNGAEGDHSVAESGELFFATPRGQVEATQYESGGGPHLIPLSAPCNTRSLSTALYASWVGEELRQVRNVHASFHATSLGFAFGLVHAALSCFVSKGKEPWTFRNTVPDSAKTEPAVQHQEIVYPKTDGRLTFDLLTNLQRSGECTAQCNDADADANADAGPHIDSPLPLPTPSQVPRMNTTSLHICGSARSCDTFLPVRRGVQCTDRLITLT